MVDLLKDNDVLVKNYISVSISCDGVEIELESSDLTFDELEAEFFEIYEKLPVNGKKEAHEVNIN